MYAWLRQIDKAKKNKKVFTVAFAIIYWQNQGFRAVNISHNLVSIKQVSLCKGNIFLIRKEQIQMHTQ